MGYRLRLGKVSKADHEKYKELTYEQFEEEFGDSCSPYRPPFHTQLYEIGKYVDYSEGLSEFYKEPDEECEFKIATKEWLEKLIEEYRVMTGEYMRNMLRCVMDIMPDDDRRVTSLKEKGVEYSGGISADISCGITNPQKELLSFFYGMYQEWTRGRDFGITPFYLNDPDASEEERKDIVMSWKIQYAVLNIVYIYNTFDWENDLLIYSGW